MSNSSTKKRFQIKKTKKITRSGALLAHLIAFELHLN